MKNDQLRKEIKQLEKTARLLEPDAGRREKLSECVVASTEDYLKNLNGAPTYTEHPSNGRALYDSGISEEGIGIDQALSLLDENVHSSGVNLTSGRYLGYIPGGGLFHSALGDYLAAVTNRFAGLYFVSPGAVQVENMLLHWMADLIGYPPTVAGNLTSGGSTANLTALVVARDAHGITGKKIDKSVVYLTEHVHHCIDKALHIAGLDGCIRRSIPVDNGCRMDADALAASIAADKKSGLRPWLVIASAGTTNTGSVDPLDDIDEALSVLRQKAGALVNTEGTK